MVDFTMWPLTVSRLVEIASFIRRKKVEMYFRDVYDNGKKAVVALF